MADADKDALRDIAPTLHDVTGIQILDAQGKIMLEAVERARLALDEFRAVIQEATKELLDHPDGLDLSAFEYKPLPSGQSGDPDLCQS